MQDRFKFRIWYEPEKKMMLFNNPTLLDGKVCSNDNGGLLFRNYDHNIKDVHECKPEDFKIMQCTGLKDKNGKLIYEGDIVVDNEGDKAIIEYNDLHACFQFNFGDDYREFGESDVDIEQCEIIGNIYENPGLLE